MTDRSTAITSYTRWEQAFRVFLDVYSARYPNKVNELVQYNHIIYNTSQSYQWDNVYAYDREFCRHVERHPTRNWGVILQQAWTMLIKDRIVSPYNSKYGNGSGTYSGESGSVQRKLCFLFNQDECTYGRKCKFEHRCSLCNKFEHGAHNCRKAQNVMHGQNKKHSSGEGHHQVESAKFSNIK